MGSDAVALGRVLAVYDNDIGGKLPFKAGESLLQGLTATLADNVANKKYLHAYQMVPKMRSPASPRPGTMYLFSFSFWSR